MQLTNQTMEAMIEHLTPYLDRVDIIGYAAARNIRKLKEGCQEFAQKRSELVQKYGHEILEDGQPTGEWVIEEGAEGYETALEIITNLATIEHDIDLFKVPYEKTIGLLSGSDILNLDFMLEEDDEQCTLNQ